MTAVLNYFGQSMPMAPPQAKIILSSTAVNGVLQGTGGNDFFKITSGDGYTIEGTGGGDSFYGVDSTDTITEPVGSTGVTTAYVYSNYVMQPFLTNLIVYEAIGGVTGNAKANYIDVNATNIWIDGGGGNDVFTVAAGDNVRFDANSGFDAITNFAPGPRTSVLVGAETVQLAGYPQFTTFSQVVAAMTQVGSNVILTLDANDAIEFQNTTISQFTSDNFLLVNSFSTTTHRMTFDAEFNNNYLSASTGGLGTIWRTDTGGGSNNNALSAHTLAGTGELELYVDPTFVSTVTNQRVGINPFSFSNGVLDIHAGPAPVADQAALYGYTFTSGMLCTKDSFTQTYGYFEARMEMPVGDGAWPCFWLYSANGNRAEIDIAEAHQAYTLDDTEHSYVTGSDSRGTTAVYVPDLSTSFNTFGLLWTPTTLTWYLNGVATRSIATPADMNGPMYMVIDLALNETTPSTFTGADLLVDYVHAYSLNNLPSSVTGSSNASLLNDLAGPTTLAGTSGYDTFDVAHAATVVDESTAGGSIVYTSVNYTLPTNVSKMYMTASSTQATSNSVGGTLVGNNNGDTFFGTSGHDTMIGGTGNDTFNVGSGGTIMTGGGGSDTFVFGPTVANDQITDFAIGVDHVNFAALAGHAFTLQQDGTSSLLTFQNDGQIIFQNVNAATLAASDAFAHSVIHQSANGTFFGTI